MSDQPPGGPPGPLGPEEERPAPLIPSRAARHQKPQRRLFGGRGARPPADPPASARPGPRRAEPPRPEPPRQSPPPQSPPRREWPGQERAREAPTGQEPPRRRRPRPALGGPAPREGDELRRQRPRVRAVPQAPGRVPSRPRDEPDGEPRRRPALKAPRLQVPKVRDLRSSSLGLAGTLVAVAAVLVLGVNALPSAKPPAAPVTRDPYSARWVCPLLGGQTTAVTVANVGTAPAALRTTVRENGKRSAPKLQQLAAGATQRLSLKPAKEGLVQVEAFSAPVVVSTPGIGCAAGPGDRWWLPASDTRLGTDTKVIIANPESEPAVVDLVPHLTSGSIRSNDREVFIKPGEAQLRTLGDDAPAGLKPSIEVIARAGRVVVGAAVSSPGKQPTLLPAQGTAKPSWSFAGGVSGGGSQTQVLVTNPNATPLHVDVQVATSKGTFRPPGEFGEPINNGGTAELDIPALDVRGPFAVQVRSVDGAPFVAALRVTQGDGNRTTSRIDLGTGQPEQGWLVPGATGGGELVLANLSSDELEARLGDLTAGGAASGQPVRLPPGRVTVKKVPDGIENLIVQAATAGLVAAPRDGGPVVPGSAIGGLPAGGPVVPGPAAAP